MSKVRSSSPILTDRLMLRRWRGDDRAPFAKMNADPRVMEFFVQVLDRDTSDALVEKFEVHFEAHGFGFWALEDRASGAFAGFTGLQLMEFEAPFTPCVEVGWRLPFAFWGRGLASEAARAAIAYGFESLRLPEIVACTAFCNMRSQRVMERIGMARVPNGDFIHPKIPPDHPLQPSVLYRIRPSSAIAGGRAA